jgi:hypothetical protein
LEKEHARVDTQRRARRLQFALRIAPPRPTGCPLRLMAAKLAFASRHCKWPTGHPTLQTLGEVRGARTSPFPAQSYAPSRGHVNFGHRRPWRLDLHPLTAASYPIHLVEGIPHFPPSPSTAAEVRVPLHGKTSLFPVFDVGAANKRQGLPPGAPHLGRIRVISEAALSYSVAAPGLRLWPSRTGF